MYAYMKMNAPKKKKDKGPEGFADPDEEDSDMEAFANKEIMKKMKDGDDVDSDEDMDDINYSEGGESDMDDDQS
jgi:hypothetical protein